MRKVALVFGVGGQDGSYLAELLLSKGYAVFGTHRRSSVDNLVRVKHLLELDEFTLLRCDVTDAWSVRRALETSSPHEVYNMADQDHVAWSSSCARLSLDVTVGGVLNIMEAVDSLDAPRSGIRVCQPVSATIYGREPNETPQTPDTELRPVAPYGWAKAHVLHMCRGLRRSGVWVCCPILYNHDSVRRGGDYLLQKIARGEKLDGDTSTPVDVGHAPEYCEAMWRMVQTDEPYDLLIGTGYSYTIKDLVGYAAALRNGTEGGVRRAGILGGDRGWLTPDVTQARRVLNWQADKNAADVLRLLVRHYAGNAETRKDSSVEETTGVQGGVASG